MVNKFTKRRVTQIHLDAISKDSGPVYGVRLIAEMPLNGGMIQAMPSRSDLERVRPVSERTVAGYEVLLQHYREEVAETERLRKVIQCVIADGHWNVTSLQEAIGNGK